MAIINRKELAKYLNHVDQALEGLDVYDKIYVLNALVEKYRDQVARMKSNDFLHGLPFGSLIKKTMKNIDEEGEI